MPIIWQTAHMPLSYLMCGKWRFFTHVKNQDLSQYYKYYDILHHLPNHWTCRCSKSIFDATLNNRRLLALRTSNPYNTKYDTACRCQNRISKDSYYSLYVHIYLRNANTRDIVEEEHKVPNRVITYFNPYTYVASVCRFLTRYGFTQHDYLTRYAYCFFILMHKIKSLCIFIIKTRIMRFISSIEV